MLGTTLWPPSSTQREDESASGRCPHQPTFAGVLSGSASGRSSVWSTGDGSTKRTWASRSTPATSPESVLGDPAEVSNPIATIATVHRLDFMIPLVPY